MKTPLHLITIFLICLVGRTNAQTRFPRLEFKPGDTTASYQTGLRVYSKPSGASAVIGTLDLGQLLVIREKTEVFGEIDGQLQYWYRVAFGKHHKQEGYVFGGFLATAYAEVPDKTFFLLHFIAGENDREAALLEIKVIKNGEPEVTFFFRFRLTTNDTLAVRVSGNRGYDLFRNIILFDFQNRNCPENHREIGALWDGEKAMQLPSATPVEEGVGNCVGYTYVFPNDQGGRSGQVGLKVTHGAGKTKWVRYRLHEPGVFVPIED